MAAAAAADDVDEIVLDLSFSGCVAAARRVVVDLARC